MKFTTESYENKEIVEWQTGVESVLEKQDQNEEKIIAMIGEGKDNLMKLMVRLGKPTEGQLASTRIALNIACFVSKVFLAVLGIIAFKSENRS